MLGDPKFKVFLDLINGATKDELIWMNGYLNGVVQGQSPKAIIATAAMTPTKKHAAIKHSPASANANRNKLNSSSGCSMFCGPVDCITVVSSD